MSKSKVFNGSSTILAIRNCLNIAEIIHTLLEKAPEHPITKGSEYFRQFFTKQTPK